MVQESFDAGYTVAAHNNIAKHDFLLILVMYKRLNELNFVIGLFFSIVSLILLLDYFFNRELSKTLNLYTGLAFLAFGLFMIVVKRKNDSK